MSLQYPATHTSGATPLGRLVNAAALGAYIGSALRDWVARQDIRTVDVLAVK